MSEMRKCVGSAKFGIEAHEAPPGDFPSQPSQKDGLGRMCKTHWKQYVTGLARERKARKAVDAAVHGEGPMPPAGSLAAARKESQAAVAEERRKGRQAQQAILVKLRSRPATPVPKPPRKPAPITRFPRGRRQAAPQAGSQGDAG